MNLKPEIRKALESGMDRSELLKIVRRHKNLGIGQRDAYDALHELWVEYGFDTDESETENSVRDHLESAMEIVWGFCASSVAIWDGSLTKQNQPT